AHDLGVEAGDGRGRHDGGQGVQVGGAADPGHLAAFLQLVEDGDGVGRLASPVQVGDDVEDDLVGRPVEVVGPQDLDDVGDGVLGQQHAAQHRLLCLDVVGRRALETRARTDLLV